ncbi:MAG: hypothetical protein AB1938_16345 [Myxococcota bacterium]
MRLTINLDDDLYAIAKSEAHHRDVSISAAVNDLLRRALQPGLEPVALPIASDAFGWPVVRGKKVVTSEDVKALDDEP